MYLSKSTTGFGLWWIFFDDIFLVLLNLPWRETRQEEITLLE
ncbi:MAG: hypothetical protein ACI81T_000450 [Bacteroidia bacterium]|jgi:hypothetical protein